MALVKGSIFILTGTLFCLCLQCTQSPPENEEDNAPSTWCGFEGTCAFDFERVDSLFILKVEGQPVTPNSNEYYPIALSGDLKFRVEGISRGVAGQPGEAYIYLLIYPKYPQGAGWYIEKTTAQVEENTGDWFAVGQLGSKVNFFPRSGENFFIKVFITEECEKMDRWRILTPTHIQSELTCEYLSSSVVKLEVK